jgi:hypothetical protein
VCTVGVDDSNKNSLLINQACGTTRRRDFLWIRETTGHSIEKKAVVRRDGNGSGLGWVE